MFDPLVVAIVLLVPCAVALAVAALLLRGARRRRVACVAAAVSCLLTAGGLTAVLGTAPDARAAGTPAATAKPTLTPTSTPTPTATLPAGWGPSDVANGPGYSGIASWTVPAYHPAAPGTVRTLSMPTHGRMGTVIIPATTSLFRARPAIVYLPPAALTGDPVRLPVVIAFSGQSKGSGPWDVVRPTRGDIFGRMNAFAAAHGGVAPIVVVPDQLGYSGSNPMCVNSKTYGDVSTYLMIDVRRWIETHLPVRIDRRGWAIAGFSEGGTCSIQFAAAHPSYFGAVIDVSGEQAPANGTLAHTIAVGFGGSTRAYDAATPFHLLATHHYSGLQAYFSAGALDAHYGAIAPVMEAHAKRAGMTVHRTVIRGQNHNWKVGGGGMQWAIEHLAAWWGI